MKYERNDLKRPIIVNDEDPVGVHIVKDALKILKLTREEFFEAWKNS